MSEELKIKTERIVGMLHEEKLDGVLLNAQHNFAWASCGGNNGVDQSRENGVANLLFCADGRRFVLANIIELQRILDEEVPQNTFEPVEFSWQDEKASGVAIETARKIAGPEIATDIPMHNSAAVIESKIAPLRFMLTETEKMRYRELGQDAAKALSETILAIQPGQSELQITETMRHELGKLDVTAVVALVAADERIAKFRHPVPAQNVWKKTLMLVACAKRGGLIVNLTRMIRVGEIPTELSDKTNAAAFKNAKLWSATKPGISSRELYEIAANAYRETGFGDEIDLHHQGGATGYRTRDWVAHPAGNDIVVTDQAFAWNPSITGTKIEETMFVNGGVPEVITLSGGSRTISNTIDGVEYRVSGIHSV